MESVYEFRLSEGERAHPVWLRLKTHLESRLAATRVQNDDSAMTEAMTAALRGRIACLKQIIALGDDHLIVESERQAKF